ncbi:hypothetical protein [Vampirovibrio sp.]|uniref:hypothetical protein n=1 Tax=Vampirovibrio sp. TaxID=2717857 RepID=UPI003593951F
MLELFHQAGQWASQKAQSMPLPMAQTPSNSAPYSGFYNPSPGGEPVSPPWAMGADPPIQTTQSKSISQSIAGWTKPTQQFLQDSKEGIHALSQKALQRPWLQALVNKLHTPKTQPENPYPPGTQASKTHPPKSNPLSQKLRPKKNSPQPHTPPPSPYRSRQVVLKDFPFRKLESFPHYTLSPADIAESVQAEKLKALTLRLAPQAQEPDNIFIPVDYLDV